MGEIAQVEVWNSFDGATPFDELKRVNKPPVHGLRLGSPPLFS
jgi:hypothetical protein